MKIKYIVFLVLIFFFSPHSPAEDDFLRAIKSKDVSSQKKILKFFFEYRSRFSDNSDLALYFKRYFELSPEKEELKFLIDLKGRSQFPSFKSSVNQAFSESCPQYPKVCLMGYSLLSEEIDPGSAVKIVEMGNFDLLLSHRSEVELILNSKRLNAKQRRLAFEAAVRLGLSAEADQLFAELNQAESTQDQHKLYVCRYYYLIGKFSESASCFSGSGDLWLRVYSAYNQFLMGDKKSTSVATLKPIFSSISAPKSDWVYLFVFHTVLFGEIPSIKFEEVKNDLSKNYFLLFTILTNNRKKNFLNAQQKIFLEEQLQARFPNSTLNEIYYKNSGEVLLKKGISKNHLLMSAF